MTRARQRPRDLAEVLARKRELAARSEILRRALAEHAAGLAPALAAGDKVAGVGRSILAHPLLLAGAGLVLLVVFRRATLALAGRGFALWKGAGALRHLLARSG